MTLDGLLTDEAKAVSELRSRMKGEMTDDLFEDDNLFIRFLRARNFNINAAEVMLRNHITWRKTIQLDRILTDFTAKEVFRKYMTLDHIGFDKEGYLMIYAEFGNLDTKGLLKSISKSEIVKSTVQILEVGTKIMKEQSAKLCKTIDKFSLILDCEKLSLATATHTPTLQVAGKLLQVYEANYPERLKTAYIINASVYFTIGFSVVKHILSGVTVQKIKMLGKGWKEELLSVMDADALPAFLGGKRTDPDGNPMCETLVRHGGIVPQSYYAAKSDSKFFNRPGIKKLTIARMAKAELSFEVDNCESRIEWEFQIKGGDIDFSVLRKEKPDKNKEILPKQRIQTEISTETGMLQCKRPGTYILEFDNTYSWICQKEVYCYATTVNSSAALNSSYK